MKLTFIQRWILVMLSVANVPKRSFHKVYKRVLKASGHEATIDSDEKYFLAVK